MANTGKGMPGPECYDEDKSFTPEQLLAQTGRDRIAKRARMLARMLGRDEDEAERRAFGEGTMSDEEYLAGTGEKTEDKFLPRRR